MKKLITLLTLVASLATHNLTAGQRFALDRILVVTEAGKINTASPPNLGIAFSKIELLNPTKTIPDAKDIFLIYLEKSGEEEIKKAIEILNANPIIISAERDYYHSENAVISRTPNDPRYNSQWGLLAINAPLAWGITTGSKDVIVGIMDSGLDTDHEDLKDNLWINPRPNQTIGDRTYVNDIHGWNFSSNSATPPSSGTHGTHVAGIVGAVGNNGIGVSGVCWEVSLAMLAINASSSNAVRALEYSNFHKIRIAQNSWGGYGSPNRALYEAIKNYNGLFVVSAGNSHGDLDNATAAQMHYPVGYSLDGDGLHGFGPGLTNMITVTSSGRNDATSSVNYGATRIHIAAPGSSILSTYPMNEATNPKYHTLSGTSMAAPMVSGVVALMMSARLEADLPELTPQQIIRVLMSSARKVAVFTNRCIAGGIVDAFAAVKAALTYCTVCDNTGCPECPPEICLVCGELDCPETHITALSLNKATTNIIVGFTEQLTATILPNDATNKTITWTSGDENVATVDANGLVTAVADGTATIMATTEDGGFTRTCIVTVYTAEVTSANIQTFTPNPNEDAVAAFLAGLDAVTISGATITNGLRYRITEMAPRLNAMRAAYKTAWSTFEHLVIAMPSWGISTSGNVRAIGLQVIHESTFAEEIRNKWTFTPAVTVTTETVATSPTLVRMTGSGNNPNVDVTFTELLRNDRNAGSSGTFGSQTPHSTTPPLFGQTSGSAALNAILGIFNTTGAGAPAWNTASPDNNLVGVLNSTDGWTIIQDGSNFWFRSKADPSDWFLAVRSAVGEEPLVAATGIAINLGSGTLQIDEQLQITAIVQPANAANKTVIWTSSNADVATVDETGLVTAISAGFAVITVTAIDGNFKTYCEITVNAPPVDVTGITLNKNTMTLIVGQTEQLLETIAPSDADNQSVIWTSDDEDIATVDENGFVTAIAEGTATITATTVDGGYKAQCVVTVNPASSIVDAEFDKVLKIYPNPVTNGQLIIDNGQLPIEKLELYDINGKLVYQKFSILNSQFSMDISHLPNGTYIVKIGTHSARIIKQ
jgi:uncharacterized protein YjdB/subtilisin family serine protease